jgi:hypothetical protein
MKRGAAALLMMLWTGAGWIVPVHGMEMAEVVPWLVRLQGGVEGTYTPAEGREVNWRLAWAGGEGATRRGEIAVTGPGLELRVELGFFGDQGRLHWKVDAGRVDLAQWLPVLAKRPELADTLAGLTATGSVVVAGEGEWTGGVAKGELKVTLSDAGVGNAEQGWALEGVSIEAGGDVAELLAGRVPLALDVRTITTGRFGARALAVRATLVDFETAEVAVDVEIAGGTVRAKPFRVAMTEPKLDVAIAMERVGLQDVAALIPDLLADGRGRVNGAAVVRWSEADGLSLGAGHITIDPSERAELRFSPNPGLLTGSLPPAILKLYPGLTNLEMGKAALLAERFEVKMSPEGDAEGRTATVNIAGGPVDRTLKAPLVLTINVRGPLAPLIKFGSTSGLSLGGAK